MGIAILILIVIVFIAVSVVILYSVKEPEVTVFDNSVQIKAMELFINNLTILQKTVC